MQEGYLLVHLKKETYFRWNTSVIIRPNSPEEVHLTKCEIHSVDVTCCLSPLLQMLLLISPFVRNGYYNFPWGVNLLGVPIVQSHRKTANVISQIAILACFYNHQCVVMRTNCPQPKTKTMWNGFLVDMHEDLVKLTMFAETYSLLFDAQISFRSVERSVVVVVVVVIAYIYLFFSNSELISEFFDQKHAITVVFKRINFREARDWNRVTMRMGRVDYHLISITQTIEMWEDTYCLLNTFFL